MTGEAKRRSRANSEILAGNPRCIYCVSPASSVEHMPPIAMFMNRQRLSGFEYPSCIDCNNATRAADAAAAFFARLSPAFSSPQWEIEEAHKLVGTLAVLAPAAITEIFDDRKSKRVWEKGRDPFATPKISIKLDGLVTHALMSTYTAKLGMALFREHMGFPLPETGSVFTQCYFNAGLTKSIADRTLKILPMSGQLTMGRKSSGKQFNYRYNTDNKTIVFAFAAFHNNLFTRSVAVVEPDIYRHIFKDEYNSYEVKLGGLRRLAEQWTPSKKVTT